MPTDTPTSARAAFAALLQRLSVMRQAGIEPLVVFDLDGTLYDNTHRTLRILLEFAYTHAARHPDFLNRMQTVAPAELAYRVDDSLRRIGMTDEALIAEVVDFWFKRFFTNEYCFHDLPLAGGLEVVTRIHKAGGVPTYLTGRDAPNMLLGTIGALQRDGFPVGRVDTRAILKPDFETDDTVFKEGVIAHLRRIGTVVGSFDNEPKLCNLFKSNFPDALVGWMDTHCAPGAPPIDAGVFTLKDFTDLL
jgi:hypothetical protein